MDLRLRELQRRAQLASGKERARLQGQLWGATLSLGVWPQFTHRSAEGTAVEVAQFASWLGDLGAREFLRGMGTKTTGFKVGVTSGLMLGDGVPTRCSIWCCERVLSLIEAVAGSASVAERALDQCMTVQLAAEQAVVERFPPAANHPPLYCSARHNFDPHLPGLDSAMPLSAMEELLRQLGFNDTGYPGSAEDLQHFEVDGPRRPPLNNYAAALALIACMRLYSSFFRRSTSAFSRSQGYIRESRPLLEPASMFLKVIFPLCENALSLVIDPDGAHLSTGRYAWISYGTSRSKREASKRLKEHMRQYFVPWATSGIVPP